MPVKIVKRIPSSVLSAHRDRRGRPAVDGGVSDVCAALMKIKIGESVRVRGGHQNARTIRFFAHQFLTNSRFSIVGFEVGNFYLTRVS